MTTPKYASQAMEDLKESTGLFDNVDIRVTEVQFNLTPPDNYPAGGIFGWVSFDLLGDVPADQRALPKQAYSLGAQSAANYDISEDGYGLIPKSEYASIRKDSKWGTFLTALATQGLPKPILQAGDFSKLIGLEGHVNRIADKARTFAEERKQNAQAKKFPPSTLVVTKIIALPGTAATSATKSVVADVVDVDTIAGQLLAQIVAKKGGKLQRGNILLQVRTAAQQAGHSNYVDIAKRATEESFLNSINENGGVVDAAGEVVALSYDGTARPQVVTIAA